ncbi:MAG: nitroreductase family deazaflavin-dependent oxidoreductase [Rhodocyclales bacterium]|nr:nitroreductase family deazaflavin-dependent oxidoreductase [Rhodocyclales bacterium]
MANDRSKLVKPEDMPDEVFQAIKDSTASLEKIRGDAHADVADYLAQPDGRGKMGGTGKMGLPTLLLTVVGRKSGEMRTTPLIFVPDGEQMVVTGSLAGYDQHPTWYLNLKADANCWVQVERKKMTAVARDATEEERKRLWPTLTEMFPGLGYFQTQTERQFPVVILSPTAPA